MAGVSAMRRRGQYRATESTGGEPKWSRRFFGDALELGPSSWLHELSVAFPLKEICPRGNNKVFIYISLYHDKCLLFMLEFY